MAGWKRARGDAGGLSKVTEALLALLNPANVRELRTLDGTELRLRFDPEGGRRWSAIVPADDGTFAALATAMALSGGASEVPNGAASVDRLGPPGSALLGQSGASIVVAGRRDDLDEALGRLPLARIDMPPGVFLRLDPEALAAPGPLNRRRAGRGPAPPRLPKGHGAPRP